MDPIRTHQELLVNLAGSGDPTAFYTLVAQFANAAYITERNSGKSHKEALSVLIPFLKTAYQDFIKTSPHKAFDSWYREYKRKYFSIDHESSDEVNLSEKGDFGNIPMADIAHFERILELILQRKYGKIRRIWKGRLVGQSHRLMRLLKTAAIIVSVGIVITMLYFFLAITKQRIILTYAFHNSSMSIVMPFSSNTASGLNGSSRENNLSQNYAPSDSLKVRHGIIHDTVKIRDTVRVFSRWNAATQSKVSTVSSSGNVNVNVPPQINKPPPSSVIVNKPELPPAPAIQTTTKTAYDSLQ